MDTITQLPTPSHLPGGHDPVPGLRWPRWRPAGPIGPSDLSRLGRVAFAFAGLGEMRRSSGAVLRSLADQGRAVTLVVPADLAGLVVVDGIHRVRSARDADLGPLLAAVRPDTVLVADPGVHNPGDGCPSFARAVVDAAVHLPVPPRILVAGSDAGAEALRVAGDVFAELVP